jgi:hypothetical protein
VESAACAGLLRDATESALVVGMGPRDSRWRTTCSTTAIPLSESTAQIEPVLAELPGSRRRDARSFRADR